FSGIISTLSIPLSEKVTARDVQALYEEKHGEEKLVHIKAGVPGLLDIENKHGWTVGGFQVTAKAIELLLWYGGLDNLLKGAATQCLQNLNLALGY
ncbi:hypothetical protein DEU56DRAFT_711550, partial [Suillus clintonianus]|uniref:uncharacterized protein n=1 Tax=Suillus clintonianus TaxID=1904413 RepID=UPI001B85CE29